MKSEISTIKEILSIDKDLSALVFELRSFLNTLNNSTSEYTLENAYEETQEYFSGKRKVFGIFHDSKIIGFSVLKIEDATIWLDWLYVTDKFRRTGVASDLFDYTEKYAKTLGCEQLYIWVHPDNQQMLKFLRKKGYDVLNLIEVKKTKSNITSTVTVFGNDLKY